MNTMQVSNVVRCLSSVVFLVVVGTPAAADVITIGDVAAGGTRPQPDPWVVGGILHVGSTADVTLTVKAGGVVSNTNGNIASYSGSTGAATITGSGSKWINSDNLFIG